jgi:hypothetical protein
MSLFKSYWTVEGISPEARDAAIRAANADGEELGIWLSRLISEVSLQEIEAVAGGVEEALGEESVEEPVEIAADISDDKLSSIERAMLQSRPSS